MPERVVATLEKALKIIERWNEGDKDALIGDAFDILADLLFYLENNTVLIIDLGKDPHSRIPETLEKLEDELAAFLKSKGFSCRIYNTCTGNTVTATRVEICNECGRSVAPGSGRFVNRIPDLNDEKTRREMGKPFPEGDYICEECDRKLSKNNDSS